MLNKILLLCLVVVILLVAFVKIRDTASENQGSSNQYGSETELDIDMFFGSREDSESRYIYGSLEVRDILTKCHGDPLRPTEKGAVLTDINSLCFAVLEKHLSTTQSTLSGVQQIFYILSGEGIIQSGKRTIVLRHGIGIIVPPDIEFTITNNCEEQLTMYIVEEPIPEYFMPKKWLVVKDEYDNPISTNRRRVSSKDFLFSRYDGLSTLMAFNPVMFEPKSFVPPHVHTEGEEEVWIAIKGEMMTQLGLQRRKLPPGTAYKVPPDGKTPHININNTDVSKKLMWLYKVPERGVPARNRQRKLKGVM